MHKKLLGMMALGVAVFQSSYALDQIQPRAIQDRLIVKLAPPSARGADAAIDFQNLTAESLGLDTEAYTVQNVISKDLGLVVIHLNAGTGLRSAMEDLQSNPRVLYVQKDILLQPRSRVPNDPDFEKMWDLKTIQAADAWEFGIGGKDIKGNAIVEAVVDGGVDIDHEDLRENIWTNAQEIPGNKIDDDHNGYVDDIHGWNAYSNNANVEGSNPRHGTHVSGTIGARGDNSLNVTGINWESAVLPVAAEDFSTSVVLASYQYVLTQKKLWLKTGGKQGANIVSTNSSFGYDYADCNGGEYPAWNDIYNEMGKVGILSAAATANLGVDVDVVGDVPTGCSSDFLVTVTNTTSKNQKYPDAGWGKVSVDLGAPGTNTLSTFPNNTVGTATGTSMATPHVTGAIGFLHSVASAEFNSEYLTNPRSAVLRLKQILLESVDIQADLEGKTVSGGRLNLLKAARAIAAYDGKNIQEQFTVFLTQLKSAMP